MKKTAQTFSIILAVVACAIPAWSAPNVPVETRNAALRYWIAFAEIQDTPADKETSELLEKTAAGEAAWDEAKLGPILERNGEAVRIMQRATRLPDCDWGLEYSLGPAASIAYAPRARVLARLNTLYGIRLAAKGDTLAAVDTWIAGIHFSRDLAKGGTLIFALMAKTALLSDLNALTQAAERGTLSPVEKEKVVTAILASPESGFDWSQALSYEQRAIEIAIKNLKGSTNPAKYYQQLLGHPAPVDLATLSTAEAVAFEKAMLCAEEAMRKSPGKTAEQLPSLQKLIDSLHPIYREMIPSFAKINESRTQVVAAREKLLLLVASK